MQRSMLLCQNSISAYAIKANLIRRDFFWPHREPSAARVPEPACNLEPRFVSVVRLRVLHYANEGPIYSVEMIEALSRQGY
jgi:hypothetical protein